MRTFNRREFLSGAVGGALVVPSLLAGAQAADTGPLTPAAPPEGYAAEAARLTDAVHATFWNGGSRQYRAPVRSAETVDSDGAHNNGYVVWPSILGFYSLVEGEKATPGKYTARMREVFHGLDAYFDPAAHGYNAWLQFPGNNDKYYDDNGWFVAALVEAYEATKDPRYRDRAAEVTEQFLSRGWDSSNQPGGEAWGTDPGKGGTGDHNACSTASAALSSIGLARIGVNVPANLKWTAAELDWIERRLRDTDDLIQDGLKAPNWRVMPNKWTYNTGATMRAHVELFKLNGDKAQLDAAKRLARAATDRTKRLYDGLVQDPNKRFWYDTSFFVPHLMEGLLAVYRATGDESIRTEMRRNANYAYQYLRDPADGLYWRNWRLWRIGDAQCAVWRKMTGQDHQLEPDDSERSKAREVEHLPIGERPLVKTLLANAATARLFWLVSQA